MPRADISEKAHRDAVRARMRAHGLGYEQIAADFRARFGYRPRAAWRHAYGWTLSQAAAQYNAHAARMGLDPQGRARMTGPHLGDYERWPDGETTRKPTATVLAILAAMFDTTAHHLLDLTDHDHLDPTDRLHLDKPPADGESGAARPMGTGPPVPAAQAETPPRFVVGVPAHGTGGLSEDGPPAAFHRSSARVRGRSFDAPRVSAVGRDDGVPTVRGILGRRADLERTMIITAAHESGEHAGLWGGQSLDQASVEQLHEDLVRVAHGYAFAPPWAAFAEARRVRDLAYRMAELTRRPGQVARLTLTMAQACALLASASFDLGHWDAAEDQARAAWVYANQVGHDSLRAWTRGMQALIAYWLGRPAEATELVRDAFGYAPPGTAMVRLRCIEARACALLGDAPGATWAIRAAQDARGAGDGTDELHDGIGGEFGFDPARQARCNGSAYVQLGDAEAAAAKARTAIALYAAMPPEQQWPKVEAQAHVDLAAAYLMRRDFDGARDALTPAFQLPPDQRVEGLVRRLDKVATLLATPPYRISRPARQLAEQIGDFTARTAHHMLGAP